MCIKQTIALSGIGSGALTHLGPHRTCFLSINRKFPGMSLSKGAHLSPRTWEFISSNHVSSPCCSTTSHGSWLRTPVIKSGEHHQSWYLCRTVLEEGMAWCIQQNHPSLTQRIFQGSYFKEFAKVSHDSSFSWRHARNSQRLFLFISSEVAITAEIYELMNTVDNTQISKCWTGGIGNLARFE